MSGHASTGARAGSRFWPFRSQIAFAASLGLLIGLPLLQWFLRDRLRLNSVPPGWTVAGIVVISAIPIALHVLDGVAASGGTVAVGSVKIALTEGAVRQVAVVIPSNAAPPGAAIADSGGHTIEEALKTASLSETIVIDLGDGTAWWETRLLLVCSGSVRLGRPRVIAFVGQVGGRPQQFIGWAGSSDLLRLLLMKVDYRQAFERAQALALAARLARGAATPVPFREAELNAKQQLINDYSLAPDATGVDPRPTINTFLEERLLAQELAPLEVRPALITPAAAINDFKTAMHTDSADQSDADSAWYRKALRLDEDFLPITDTGTYVGLMPRSAVVSTVLLQLAG